MAGFYGKTSASDVTRYGENWRFDRMSVFVPISSGLPSAPDVAGGPARGPFVNIPLEFGRGDLKKVSGFWSGIDPVGTLLAEHLEDNAAEVPAEGADGLVVSFALGAFFFVVALRLRDPFAMVIDGDHHRRLGTGVNMLWRL